MLKQDRCPEVEAGVNEKQVCLFYNAIQSYPCMDSLFYFDDTRNNINLALFFVERRERVCRASEGEETFQVHYTREQLVVCSATMYKIIELLITTDTIRVLTLVDY